MLGGDAVLTEAWECLAEAFEVCRDVDGAIYAYERLLAIEPANAPALSPTVAAKRAVQEIVLLSHRRGLEDTRATRRAIRDKAEQDVRARSGR